jgi:hypothetical protein
MTWGGESSNSDATAKKRRLEACMRSNMSAHASEAGDTRTRVAGALTMNMVLTRIHR